MVKFETLKTAVKLFRSELLFLINDICTSLINLEYASHYTELKREGCTVIRGYSKEPELLKQMVLDLLKNEKAWADDEGCDTRVWGSFDEFSDLLDSLLINDLSLKKIYKKYSFELKPLNILCRKNSYSRLYT